MPPLWEPPALGIKCGEQSVYYLGFLSCHVKEILPHADIMVPGSGFGQWWKNNRTALADKLKKNKMEGYDFWALVYQWHNYSGWVPAITDGSVDDSEEYFRDFPK